jgi:hypothetical protein
MIKQVLRDNMDLVPLLYCYIKGTELLPVFEKLMNFGGEGSGNFDHDGRPGEVGGSGGGGGATKEDRIDERANELHNKNMSIIKTRPEYQSMSQDERDKFEHDAFKFALDKATKETNEKDEQKAWIDQAKATAEREAQKIVTEKATLAEKFGTKEHQDAIKQTAEDQAKAESLMKDIKQDSKTMTPEELRAKYAPFTEHAKAKEFITNANNKSNSELQKELEDRFGIKDTTKFSPEILRGLHASFAHTEATLGEGKIKELIPGGVKISTRFKTAEAKYSSADKSITIASKLTNENLQKDINSNWHPRVTEGCAIKGTVDHEIAHAINNIRTTQWTKMDAKTTLQYEAFAEQGGRSAYEVTVSRYGATAINEAKAEAWLSYQNNGSSNAVVTALSHELLNTFK